MWHGSGTSRTLPKCTFLPGEALPSRFFDPSSNYELWRCSGPVPCAPLKETHIKSKSPRRVANHNLPPTRTCTLVANHNAQVYGGPLWLRRAAVGAEAVARLCPDPLRHLTVGQGLVHGILHRVDPLFAQLLRLRDETAGRDKTRCWLTWCQHRHGGRTEAEAREQARVVTGRNVPDVERSKQRVNPARSCRLSCTATTQEAP